MNEKPEKKDLTDKDMDELLRRLFKLDKNEQCTDEVKDRLWKKVQKGINKQNNKLNKTDEDD